MGFSCCSDSGCGEVFDGGGVVFIIEGFVACLYLCWAVDVFLGYGIDPGFFSLCLRRGGEG